MKKLVIIGASGFGREVAWLVERINKMKATWDLIGFVDDDEEIQGQNINGYPVLGKLNWLNEQENEIYLVCAVGASKVRKMIVSTLKNVKYATLIDPSVIMSERVTIGEGCIICAGTIITVNIEIGSHVIINLDCTVGHDVKINNYVTLYPSVNVSGNVCLEECVEMGTGSQIIQGLKVGNNTIVGAGSVVVKELPQNCTAVGSPAKAIKFH